MIRRCLAILGHVLVDWFDDELTDVTDLDKLLANERAKGRREAVDEMTAILKRPRVGDPIVRKPPADDVPPSSTLPSGHE